MMTSTDAWAQAAVSVCLRLLKINTCKGRSFRKHDHATLTGTTAPGPFCDLCGRPIEELKTFTEEDILALNLPFYVDLFDQAYSGRLGKTSRCMVDYYYDEGFQKMVIVFGTWECFDCLVIDPYEAGKRYRSIGSTE